MTDFFHSYGQPESRHVVVLYDKSTGEVRHIHEEIFLPGSKVLSKDQIEAAAFKRLRSSDTSRLAALHVSHSDLKPYINYRVDLKKKSLVEVNRKETNRKKRKSRRKTK
jgi:hypothetical protein